MWLKTSLQHHPRPVTDNSFQEIYMTQSFQFKALHTNPADVFGVFPVEVNNKFLT